jgi:hypothetical protein
MPLEYSKKLACFEALLLQLLDIQSRHIQFVLPYRPGFQLFYNFTSSVVAGVTQLTHGAKNRSDDPHEQITFDAEIFEKDPLQWCLEALTTHPDAPRVFDKFRLLEFLDQHHGKQP